MVRGKRMEEWNQTAAIRCTVANAAFGSSGNLRPYYFHWYGQELEDAYMRHLEEGDITVDFDPSEVF